MAIACRAQLGAVVCEKKIEDCRLSQKDIKIGAGAYHLQNSYVYYKLE